MFAHRFSRSLRNVGVAVLLAAVLMPVRAALADDSVTIGNLTFVNKGLVGAGRMAADLRDKFGETFGSGSSLAVDARSWTRTADGYQGTFYVLPDRGWNISGTFDYRARLNKLSIAFKPREASAPAIEDRQRSVVATLTDTILLTDAAGEPLTGLDPAEGGIRRGANGFPDLPQAASGRASMDAESLVLLPDGGFFIGDEYGPYIYRFSAAGRMLAAIRPPEAFIPMRKGRDHFSSNNPGPGAAAARSAQSRNRAAEQPGLRGLGVDAGRQVPGRRIAERDAPGWRHLLRDPAICPAALLRHRGSRPAEAHPRARGAAAGIRQARKARSRLPRRASCSPSTRPASCCSVATPTTATA